MGFYPKAETTVLVRGDGTLTQTVTGVAQGCHAGSTCTLPTSNVSLPIDLGTTGTSFYSSALSFGLGKVDVTPTISVAIPGNAYAGTYNSTLTFAATAGP